MSDVVAVTRSFPERNTTLLIVVLGLLFYGMNVDLSLYGDAAMYADFVQLRKFDMLTLHIGYYVALFFADVVGSRLLGLPIWESAVWLDVFAGAATLGIAYELALELFGNRRDALLTTAIFGLSGRAIANATSSEMYMLQTMFVLASSLCYVRARYVCAAICAACGLFVSPLSAFAYFLFPAYEWQRPRGARWEVLLDTFLIGAVIYLPYLIVDGNELFYGVRGLFGIRDTSGVDPKALLLNFPKYQFEAFTLLLLLVLPAILAVPLDRRLSVLFLAVALPHFYIILKLTGEDNVFLLPSDFFFSLFLVTGWKWLRLRYQGWRVASIPLAGHVLMYGAAGLLFSTEHHRGYAREVRSLTTRFLAGQHAVVVSDWGTVQAIVFFGRDSATRILARETLYQKTFDIQNLQDMQPNALDVDHLYVYDNWHAGPMSRLLRSRSSLERQAATFSTVANAERELGLRCTLLERHEGRLYKCERRKKS